MLSQMANGVRLFVQLLAFGATNSPFRIRYFGLLNLLLSFCSDSVNRRRCVLPRSAGAFCFHFVRGTGRKRYYYIDIKCKAYEKKEGKLPSKYAAMNFNDNYNMYTKCVSNRFFSRQSSHIDHQMNMANE